VEPTSEANAKYQTLNSHPLHSNVHANPSVTDIAESVMANKTGLWSPELRPLGGAAPVDCEAGGAVLPAAPPDVESADVEPADVEPAAVDEAGVGLPVSPDGMPTGLSVKAGKLIGAVISVITDGASVGKPGVVSPFSLTAWGTLRLGSTQALQGSRIQTA
jgi:hypothetical protein